VYAINFHFHWVAVWISGNIVRHINNVSLHSATLVLRWVTVCWYIILVFNQATQANSAWPSVHGRCNECCRWLWPLLGQKQQALRSSRPCYQDCWHTDRESRSFKGAGCSQSQPSGWLELYARLIEFNPCQFKVTQRGWAHMQVHCSMQHSLILLPVQQSIWGMVGSLMNILL